MKGIIHFKGGQTNHHSSLWKDSLTQRPIGSQQDEVGGCSQIYIYYRIFTGIHIILATLFGISCPTQHTPQKKYNNWAEDGLSQN